MQQIVDKRGDKGGRWKCGRVRGKRKVRNNQKSKKERERMRKEGRRSKKSGEKANERKEIATTSGEQKREKRSQMNE